MKVERIPGRDAIERRGWWHAHRYLFLRRLTQTALLASFLTGPLLGVWIFKGTLASSVLLDRVPLTDPLVLLQQLTTRHAPEATAFTGVAIVLAVYLLAGGRSYCSWVCPVNPVTDLAAWLRRRLGIDNGLLLRTATRWWILAIVFFVSATTGTIAWELVNPITTLWRAAVFGVGLGVISIGAIFLFDLLIARNGWCGHVCPVGAFYGLVGKVSLLRVAAPGRARCDDCMDCFAVCPESHVIAPALRGDKFGRGPIILSGDCTVCARCVDVCPEQVFTLTHRFDTRLDSGGADGESEPRPSAPIPEKV
jgi:ferredoxin-type protein NapH